MSFLGEQVGYAGFAIFSMALRRNLHMLARPRSDSIVLAATTLPGVSPCRFEVGTDIEPYRPGDWGNYLKAAVQAMARARGATRGFEALVDSAIPAEAGLASSAALMVASALATAAANDIVCARLDLAAQLAGAEAYLGEPGEDFDRAIVLAARPGCAARVESGPLRVLPVPIPDRWRFVIARGLQQPPRTAVRKRCDRRHAETDEALARVVSALGGAAAAIRSYPDLVERVGAMRALAAGSAHLEGDLGRRFRHVVTESARIARAEAGLRSDSPVPFGMLMNASHASLRDDYRVSCSELDGLVDIAHGAGAAGARLMGADPGGCIVALTSSETVGAVFDALRASYGARRVRPERIGRLLFIDGPSAGASLEPI